MWEKCLCGENHVNSRIQAALLPAIAQQIRTHAGFQKILEKEIATCASVSTKEEAKAREDRLNLALCFFSKSNMFLKDFHVTWGASWLYLEQAGESSVFDYIN